MPAFYTRSLPCVPPSALLPLSRSPGQRQVRGSTVSLSLFLFPLWGGKTDTSSVAGDSHLHLTSCSPPPTPPQLVVNSAATPPCLCLTVILLPPVCLHWQEAVHVLRLSEWLLRSMTTNLQIKAFEILDRNSKRWGSHWLISNPKVTFLCDTAQL